MIIDCDGKAHYVTKEEFSKVDNAMQFTRRKVSFDGYHMIGFMRRRPNLSEFTDRELRDRGYDS